MAAVTPPRLILYGAAEVRETHISWVFLCNDRAYKVKKPVILPFLDYGTAARRHAMCRAEFELNRRLAPSVYIGVRSLVPAGAALRLSDEGDPAAVDYAVEMRRYAESDTLASQLANGNAGAEELKAVGARLAMFHAAAHVEPTSGGAEAVKRALDDNFATLHGLVREPAGRSGIARCERSAGSYLASVWNELDARATAGLTRDGHCDLRLEHVLLGDDVEVVDCVEFDPGLRRIDVAADLGFLVMELREAGRPDLARVLVRSYRAAGGDPGSDTLLGFFAAYRAEVRAKVALLRAAQLPGGADGGRERARASALLALATRLRWAARAPLVIVLAGVSGSGKSTVAAALAGVSGFIHVNSDIVRKRRAGLRPNERAPQRLYDDAVSCATYAELGRIATARAGDGLIVDATFRRLVDRNAFRKAVGGAIDVLFIECRAPAAVIEARVRGRLSEPGRVSDADVKVVQQQLADAEPFDDVPAHDHVAVRSDQPLAAVRAGIADAVDARTPEATVPRIQIGAGAAAAG